MSPGACGASEAARGEALRYAAATRRFVERRRISPEVRAEALALATALEAAAAARDAAALVEAEARLDVLWRDQLSLVARKGILHEVLQSALLAVVLGLALRLVVVDAFRMASVAMAPTLLVGDHIAVSKLSYGVRLPGARRWLIRWAEPARGDVIVFENPREFERDDVKRVVGVPGDVIELREQTLYVNGVPQPRHWIGPFSPEESSGFGRTAEEGACEIWREELARGPVDVQRSGSGGELSAVFSSIPLWGVAAHGTIQCRRGRSGEREGPFERVAPGHVFVMGDNRDRSVDSRSDGGWQVPFGNVKGKATLVWWSWGRSGWWPWSKEGGVRTDRLFKRIE